MGAHLFFGCAAPQRTHEFLCHLCDRHWHTHPLTATPHGYGTNSESGWVDLSWNKVSRGKQGIPSASTTDKSMNISVCGQIPPASPPKGKSLAHRRGRIAAAEAPAPALGRRRSGAAQYSAARSGDLNYYFGGHAHQRMARRPGERYHHHGIGSPAGCHAAQPARHGRVSPC